MKASSTEPLLFISYLYPPAGGKALPGVQRTVKFVRHLKIKKKAVLTLKHKLYPDFFSADAWLSLPVKDETIIRTGSIDLFNWLLDFRSSVIFLIRRSISRIKKNDSSQDGAERAGRCEQDFGENEMNGKTWFSRLKDHISDILTFPDYAHGWILPAAVQGVKYVRQNRGTVIFATGMPWSSLIVGAIIKNMTGSKFIADFRDPWVANPFGESKSRLVKILEKRCEAYVVNQADYVTLNTEALKQQFEKRYRSQPPGKFQTLTNGFDPFDFKSVSIPELKNNDGKLIISHVGYLYGLRDPKPLLEAIRLIRIRAPELASKIRVQQIGYTDLDYDLKALVNDLALDDIYHDFGPLPYRESLGLMAASDCLLIVQPVTTTQIPSKIYEYLFLDKPIVALGSHEGALAEFMAEYGFGKLFGETEIEDLSVHIQNLILEKTGQGSLKAGYGKRDAFDIRHISNRLLSLISHTE